MSDLHRGRPLVGEEYPLSISLAFKSTFFVFGGVVLVMVGGTTVLLLLICLNMSLGFTRLISSIVFFSSGTSFVAGKLGVVVFSLLESLAARAAMACANADE